MSIPSYVCNWEPQEYNMTRRLVLVIRMSLAALTCAGVIIGR